MSPEVAVAAGLGIVLAAAAVSYLERAVKALERIADSANRHDLALARELAALDRANAQERTP